MASDYAQRRTRKVVEGAKNCMEKSMERLAGAMECHGARPIWGYVFTNARGQLEIRGTAEFLTACRQVDLAGAVGDAAAELRQDATRGIGMTHTGCLLPRLPGAWRQKPLWEPHSGLKSLVYSTLGLVSAGKRPQYTRTLDSSDPTFNSNAPPYWPPTLPYVSPSNCKAFGISNEAYRGVLVKIMEYIYSYHGGEELCGGVEEEVVAPVPSSTVSSTTNSPVLVNTSAHAQSDVVEARSEEREASRDETAEGPLNDTSRTVFASPSSPSPKRQRHQTPQQPHPQQNDALSEERMVGMVGNAVRENGGNSLESSQYQMGDEELDSVLRALAMAQPDVAGLRPIGQSIMERDAGVRTRAQPGQPRVQIHAALNSGHWVASALLPGHRTPHLFDSVPNLQDAYPSWFRRDLASAYADVADEDGAVRVKLVTPVEQEDARICGVTAAAFAIDAAQGLNPAARIYDLRNLRSHLAAAIREGTVGTHPLSTPAQKSKPSKTIQVTWHCCGKPEGPDGNVGEDGAISWLECERCGAWKHAAPACTSLSTEETRRAQSNSVHYTCNVCHRFSSPEL